MNKEAYNTAELAKDWHVTQRTIQREIKRGALKAFKVGSDYRIKYESLESYRRSFKASDNKSTLAIKNFDETRASSSAELEDAMGVAERQYTATDFKILKGPIIYAWIRNNKIFYIGQSAGGISRPFSSAHHRLSELDGDDKLMIWAVASPATAIKIEQDLIRKFKPVFNGQIN